MKQINAEALKNAILTEGYPDTPQGLFDLIDSMSIDKDGSKRKQPYGRFQNVKLFDEEYTKLQAHFPDDYLDRIDRLSYYLSNHKDKYTSHYHTILAWARDEKPKTQGRDYGQSGLYIHD